MAPSIEILRSLFLLSLQRFDGEIPKELHHLTRRLTKLTLDDNGQVHIVRNDQAAYRRQMPRWTDEVAMRLLAVVGGGVNEVNSCRAATYARFLAELAVRYTLERAWRKRDCERADTECGADGRSWAYRAYHEKTSRKQRSVRIAFDPNLVEA
jgi:hypothetical protein